MRIPILGDRGAGVTHRVALALVAGVPLLTMPIAADPYQPVRGLAMGIAGVGVAAAATLVALPRGRSARVALYALAAVALFAAVSALAAGPASAIFGVHGRFQGLVSGLVALIAVGIGLASGARLRWFSRSIALALVAEALVVGYQVLAGLPPTGTFGNTVLAGAWLAIGTAVSVAGARAETGRTAVALAAAAAAGAVAVGATGSRGAWVGLVAGLVPVVMSTRGALRRVAAVALVGMVLGGALLSGAGSAPDLSPDALAGGSTATRLAIWRATSEMVADAPVLGVGPGRFVYEFPRYQEPAQALAESGARADQAHSLPLQIAAESGIPAALAAVTFYVIAVLSAVRGARRGDAAALVALSGLAAWGASGVFGIATIEADALGLVLAGVALARSGKDPIPPRDGRAARWALGAASVVVIVACAVYLRADATHLAGVRAFESGAMSEAAAREHAAVRGNPLVDIYRVGVADAALYGGSTTEAALSTVRDGLVLEPGSYDLAIAEARLLASQGVGATAVLDAYLRATELYPLGIDAHREAIRAATAAGRDDIVRALAEDVLALDPDDEIARDALERVGDGP